MSDAYYRQWQRFPKPASEWQREAEHVDSEGRLHALQHVVNTSKSVLDVGCGIGLDHQPLSNLAYLGVDVTPKFTREARRNGVPCVQASALQLPFKDGSFDTVYCRNLLLHLPPEHVMLVLDEMLRVARNRVVTVEPEWTELPDYHVRELIDIDPNDVLLFFSNTYSRRLMVEYAESRGITLKWHVGHDVARSNFLHKPVNWQVTDYQKPQLQHCFP
jgi:SAM-dependent methyltransferase